MDLCPVRLDESHWPRLEVKPVHTAISVSKHTHFLHLAHCVTVTSLLQTSPSMQTTLWALLPESVTYCSEYDPGTFNGTVSVMSTSS